MDEFDARLRDRLAALAAAAPRDPARLSVAGAVGVRRPGRTRTALPIGAAAVAIALVLAVIVMLLRPSDPSPAATPTPTATPTATPCPEPVTVRWFLGLGTYLYQSEVDAARKFADTYNKRPCTGIRIELEAVPHDRAVDALKTDIAAGRAPDIVGPAGGGSWYGFEGLFLDLTTQAARYHTDLTDFEPTVLYLLRRSDSGQLTSMPYRVYPGVIAYNKDMFAKAHLPDLPLRVGEKYQGQDWTWDALAAIAKQLTLDSSGHHPNEPGFDTYSTIQYGLDFGWTDARRMASCFGGGSFLVEGTHYTPEGGQPLVQIPPAWAHAWNWYHDAIFKHKFAFISHGETLLLADSRTRFARGQVAMETTWLWELSGYADEENIGRASIKNWGIAVMPSYDGQTSSPVDVDGFAIAKASKNPDQAYQAMLAIMTDPSLRTVYGGPPARASERDAYFADLDARLARVFPDNQVDWSAMTEMANYPAIPGPDAYLPFRDQSVANIAAFFEKLRTDPDLDVDAEMTRLEQTLTIDWGGMVTW
jgi:multiple sugar transport system substrate-binding protein